MTIVPGEPELLAEQPGELGAAERCRHVVHRRDDEVGRHDRPGAGGDRRPERRELDRQQLLARRRDDGQSEVRVDVGRAVAGKVLRAGGDPSRLQPGHERGDVAGDQRGVGAERADSDHRIERVDVDIGDRSEIQRDAGRAQLFGEGAGDLLGERDVVDRAERECAGNELPRPASRRVTSPPSSSIATTVAAETLSDPVRACSCSGPATLRANRTTPPRPSASSRESQVGAVVPAKPGQDAPVRQALERVAHPLVAPAVRPKAILRWTSRKKATTGIAVSVEAAISPPQSVLRLVP